MGDQEFLVDVSFNVDEGGASAAQGAVEGLESAVQQLGEILTQAAGLCKTFIDSMSQTSGAAGSAASAMSGAAESVNGLAESASNAVSSSRELSEALENAGSGAESAAGAVGEFGGEAASAMESASSAVDGFTASEEGAVGSTQSMAEAMHAVEEGAFSAADSLNGVSESAGSASDALNSTTEGAASAGEALSGAAEAVGEFVAKMEQAGPKAQEAAEGFEEANEAAAMDNAPEGADNLKELESQLSKAADAAKKFAAAAVAAMIGSSFKEALKDVIEFNRGLASEAKALKMSTEAARAHLIALQVMGKTAEEIKDDASLQAVYKDLTALGKSLALPQAAEGVKGIQRIQDSLMQLKVVGQYAMQWIHYKINEVAAGPLKELHEHITGMRDWLAGNLQSMATAIGTAFKWAIQIINSVITVVKGIAKAIDSLPPSIKAAGAIAIAVIAAVHSKMFLISLIIGAILLLVDDFVTYMQGGESLFGGFWGKCIEWAEKVKPVLNDIISQISTLITNITTAWTNASDFLDFVKRLALGDDYQPDASWETVGQKIFDAIKRGFKQTGEWIFGLLFPDGVPDDIGGGDWSSLANKILGKITEGMKVITGIGGAVLEGTGNMAVDLATGILDAITATLGNTEFGGITDAVTGLVKRLLSVITSVFSSENLSKVTDSIKGLIMGLFTAIGGIIGDIGTSGVLTDMGQTIVDLISAIFDSASTLLSGFKVDDLLTGAGKLVKGLFDAITNMFSKENIGKVADSISGFVSSLVGAISDALSGGLDAFGGAAGIDIGSGIADIVSNLLGAITSILGNAEFGEIVDAVTGLVKKLLGVISEAFSSDNLSQITESVKGLVLGLFSAIGGILGDIGTSGALTDIGQTIVDLISSIFDAASTLLTDFKVDDLVTGAGKLVSGLFDAIKNMFSEENVGEVSDSISGFVSSLIGAISDALGSMVSALGGMSGGDIGADFAGIITNILDGIKTVLENAEFGEIVTSATDLVKKLLTVITSVFSGDNLSEVTDGIKELVMTMFTSIGGIMSDIGTSGVLTDIGQSIVDLISSAFTAASTLLTDFNIDALITGAGDLVDGLFKAITNMFSEDNVGNISDSISGFISNLLTAIADAVNSLAGEADIVTDAGNAIVDLVTGLLDGAANVLANFDLGDVTASVGDLVGKLFDAISNMFSEDNIGKLSTSISGVVSNLLTAISNAIKGLAGEADIVTDAGNAIVDLVSGLLTGASDILANFDLGGVTDSVATLVSNLFTAIVNIFSSENIGKVADSIKGFVSNLLGAIGDALSGALDAVGSIDGFTVGAEAANIVTNLLDAIFKGIEDLSTDTNVTGFVEKLGQGLSTALESIGETVGTFAGKIVSWIFSGDAVQTIFDAGANIVQLLLKGVEFGITSLFNLGFSILDGILVGLGIMDPDTAAAHTAAMETGRAYKEAVKQAFKEGFAFEENDADIGNVTNSLIQALMLSYTGEDLDDQALEWLASSIKSKIEEATGEVDIDDSRAAELLEGKINQVKEDLQAAANKALTNGDIDFTGADVKAILGPFLEQFGAGAEFLTDEMYSTLADYMLNGGPENEIDMWAILFANLLGEDFNAEDAAEKQAEAAREAGKELGIETKEEVQEGYQEGLSSGEQGTSTVDVGDVEVVGGDVSVSQDVTVEAGEVDADPLSDAVKAGAIEKMEELDTELAAQAQASADAAADQFAAVLSEASGKSMAGEFVSGLASGLAEAESKASSTASSITSALSKIPKTVDIEANLKGASGVKSLVSEIIEALNKIPRTITVTAKTEQQLGFGGKITSETHATIGEDGTEYVIPITKRGRAINLLKQAANDLGLTLESADNARRSLGGDAMRSFTPSYAAASSVSNSSVMNINNVSAPATINVTGTDPRAIANNVSRQQERLVLRNIKSAIA